MYVNQYYLLRAIFSSEMLLGRQAGTNTLLMPHTEYPSMTPNSTKESSRQGRRAEAT